MNAHELRENFLNFIKVKTQRRTDNFSVDCLPLSFVDSQKYTVMISKD